MNMADQTDKIDKRVVADIFIRKTCKRGQKDAVKSIASICFRAVRAIALAIYLQERKITCNVVAIFIFFLLLFHHIFNIR